MAARVWVFGAMAMLPAVTHAASPAAPEPPTELDPITVEGRPPPVPRIRLNPPYPMEAKRRWEEGCVVLKFLVRPDGKTDEFTVLESKPRGVFEKTVIGAVFNWQYAPSAESQWVVETFEFRSQSLSTHPRYRVASAVNVPIGFDQHGLLRYRADLQLQGYSAPTCDRKKKT